MKEIIQRYPVPEEKQLFLYAHPVFTMDLHGYSQKESDIKMQWLKEYHCLSRNQTIQIITGKGTGVLQSFVTKKLKQWLRTNEIKKWEEKDTGVFVYIA